MANPSSTVRLIRIFVSSPSDVGEERRVLDEVIDRINRTDGQSQNVRLEKWRWEDNLVPRLGPKPQDVVDAQLPTYDVYLGIMAYRFGTPTGSFGSGTEKEFNDALQQWGRVGKPWILFYFNEAKVDPLDCDLEQLAKVAKFREQVQKLGLYTTYEGLHGTSHAFGDQVDLHLRALIPQLLEPAKASEHDQSPQQAQPNEQEVAPEKGVAVVPKGLRSFDEHDAEFFLSLLPGPYREDGLPESLFFWKTRIEQVDAEKTFRVGVIYGPSGCGKSSLVRAGLLPHLDDSVVPIIFDATPADTENRLLVELKKHASFLNPKSSLQAALHRKDAIPDGKKILIVIDQFEQWLHGRDESDYELLGDALRECDGSRIQCILMIRDDFWTPLMEFAHRIGDRIRDGENAALVNRFSEQHAKRVLALFGQAYGALASANQLTSPQESFLKNVVDGLSESGRVISVRIALFAQMVRDRKWEPATLERFGGIEGVGVAFLEESLASRDAPATVRSHQRQIEAVLRLLLPQQGGDIKGASRSRSELLEAASYVDRPGQLDALLEILDSDLRLITPTEPSGQTEETVSEGSYQLTHDYLVPSLREWLSRKQQETRKGRAELKLAERAALWNAKPENRHLPSISEWASIRTLTDTKKWTESQRKVMGKAGQVHGLRSLLVLAGLALVVFAGVTIRDIVNERQATQIVKGLLKADTSQVKMIIEDELAGFRKYAEDDLRKAFAESPVGSNARLHSALAMLPNDKSVLPTLKDRLLTVTPMQFQHVRDLLQDDKDELVASYWATAKRGDAPALRFQAACALASYDSNNDDWRDEDFQNFVAGHLVGVRPSELLPWTNALRPVKEYLIEPLTVVYRDDTQGESVRDFSTDTLANYLRDDAEGLFDLLADANEQQFGPIFARLIAHQERAIELGNTESATPFPEDATEAEKEATAMRQANAAVMLLRMDVPERVWQLLKHSPDPRVRSYIIHWLSPRGGDAQKIVARYEQETDDTIKRALLLCLGEFELPDSDKQPLIEKLLQVYRSDPDAGLHAAAEWLLRRWDQAEQLAAIDKELQQKEDELVAAKDEERQWYVNSQGQTFVILDAGEFQMGSPETEAGHDPHEALHSRKIGRRIAVATTEVTREQWRRFYDATEVWRTDHDQLKPYIRSDDSPMLAMTWYEAAHYCNWLSEQEGIVEHQWCYEKNEEDEYGPGMKAKDNFLELTGYRLPTEAEWEFACRAGARTSRYYGETESLLPRYAWYLVNADNHTHPVASLKPNDFGLFGMQGNAYEWCYDAYESYPTSIFAAASDSPSTRSVAPTGRRVLRGGAVGGPSSLVRSSNRDTLQPGYRSANVGIRPARTYHVFP